MKQLKAIAFAVVTSFITTSGAFAQARAAQANVPFSFTVGSKTLPAGTYTLTTPEAGLIEVQNRESHAAAVSLVLADSTPVKGTGKLVFNRYGNRYFLKEVLCPGASMAAALPASKQEKQARTQEAMLPVTSEIFLAMK